MFVRLHSKTLFLPVRFAAFSFLVAGLTGTAQGQLCLLPENESGTVDLPLDCQDGYENPEDSIEITDGLPDGSSIRAHLSWTFSDVTRLPGGHLGGAIQTFTPTIVLNLRGTGEFAGFSQFTPLTVNASGEEHSGSFFPFFPSQSIALELVALKGEALSFNPSFSMLRFEAGSAFGLPATMGEAILQLDEPGVCVGGQADGESCARDDQCPDSNSDGFCEGGDNDGGPCATSGDCPDGVCVNRGSCVCPDGPCDPAYVARGYFDVNYRIEYVGKSESRFEGFSGMQTGTIRARTGANPAVFMRSIGGFGHEIDAAPGESLIIDTYVRQLVPARLSAYQVTLPMEAQRIGDDTRGSIRHAPHPPVVDVTRRDWVFSELLSLPWVAPIVDCTLRREPTCYASVYGAPRDMLPLVTDSRYLAHFTYEVSADAAGDFEIEFLASPPTVPGPFTYLLDEELNTIPAEAYSTIVHVAGKKDPVPGPPFLVHGAAGGGETYPCTGYIDPRLESDNRVDLNMGVRDIIMVFNEPVFKSGGAGTMPADSTSFLVTETGGGAAPDVVGVTTSDNITFELTLARPITPQEWTTIPADVVDMVGNPIDSQGDLGPGMAEPDRLDIAFLPGDVNQDGITSPQDLTNLRQYLTTGSFHNDCADLLYFDIDRDGVMPEPQDLLRFRQMLTGTHPATRTWMVAELNNPQL